MCQHCAELDLYEADAKAEKELILDGQIMKMQLMGIFFGYPVCCIMAFTERARRIQVAQESRDLQAFNEACKVTPIQEGFSEGFIPCVSCASKVRPGEEWKLIQKTRICSTPFPDDQENAREFNEFIAGAFK